MHCIAGLIFTYARPQVNLTPMVNPKGQTGMNGVVRDAREDDMAQVRAIYAHHVLHGAASFEEEPPTLVEMQRRRADVLARRMPYLVAEIGGEVVGYAYASPYRARPAYRFTLENSVYVDAARPRAGIGRTLLAALIARCEQGDWRQMIAVIGDSANTASIGLHATLGFRRVGTLQAVGFKFGRWIDSVLMQRALCGTARPRESGDPGPGARSLDSRLRGNEQREH
jgi:L-amino acid N-acyltransferase YncA